MPDGGTAHGHVTHDAVGDPEHAGRLVERGRLGLEMDEVVDALVLLVDLVGEPAFAPRLVAGPGAAALLDELAQAREDLVPRSSASSGSSISMIS